MSEISKYLQINVFRNGDYLKTSKSLQTPDGHLLDEKILHILDVPNENVCMIKSSTSLVK